MAAEVGAARSVARKVPESFEQVTKLARYQLREYVRSRRFVALLVIVIAIGAILTVVLAHFRGLLVSDTAAFYGSFWGGAVDLIIILSAVFFGGDAIAGEFQNKTGYFLMGLPIRRGAVYAGKFLAAFLASVAILLIYLAILLLNGIYYFHANAFPWQLGVALVLALVYLAAVMGATFFFSSLFKISAYGFVLTAILFLFGFSLLADVATDLVKIEPWMIISYAESTIGSVFATNPNWGFTGVQTVAPIVGASWSAGIGEGIVIMIGYFLISALGGLWLFEREEFS